MNSVSKTKKIISAAVLVVVVSLAVYFLVFRQGGGAKSDGLLTVAAENPADALLGRDLLGLLAQLKAVRLDDTLFESSLFTNLRDFGVEIVKQDVGRHNPFAPVSAAAGAAAAGQAGSGRSSR